MRIHLSEPVFARDCLDDSSGPRSVREFLALVRDGKLRAALRTRRHRVRQDYLPMCPITDPVQSHSATGLWKRGVKSGRLH